MKGVLVASVLSLAATFAPHKGGESCARPIRKPTVQIAILLDTSNSMDGLINQAKTQLWKIVNEFATAKRYGLTPDLQVALYEYGKQTIPAQEGFLRQVLPFTNDLDKVSEQLFALTTNGGEEYCGRVIQAALNGLAWSGMDQDLKVIFIAGNEPFTQGNIDYRESCKSAIAKGVVVNTIHCGSYDEGVRGMWQDGAVRAEGKFFCINQDLPMTVVSAPQDSRLLALNESLNRTYVAYGANGKDGQARQEAQDKNAGASAPAVLAERAASKSSSFYSNSTWDLVDALRDKKIKLEDLKDSELPAEIQKLAIEERKIFVQTKMDERVKIQTEIQKISEERAKFIAEKQKELSKDGNSLDQAMIQAIRELAEKKGFEFKK